MTSSIARVVGGDDVVSGIAAAFASRAQMLSRALLLPCLSLRQAVRDGERGVVITPHWFQAVIATSELTLESFAAKTFAGFLAHGSPENG